MPKSDKKKRNWRDKYKFSVTNDATFEEVWRVRLTKYNAFLLISFTVLFITGVTVSLIAFTDLREFIPGYPDITMKRNIITSAIRLDSLEKELDLRDKYFANINSIVSGKEPVYLIAEQDTARNYKNIQYPRSYEDSIFRGRIEKEEKFNLTINTGGNEGLTSLAGFHFFPPVKGIVSSKYDIRLKHFGVDIVSRQRSPVSAALDGTVIFTGWTMETGYVIEIQHINNLITVYKHNSSLLKESGDLVRAGEAISVIGDSGELYTSGPHLHFEIWYKGNALDPEKHILF